MIWVKLMSHFSGTDAQAQDCTMGRCLVSTSGCALPPIVRLHHIFAKIQDLRASQWVTASFI